MPLPVVTVAARGLPVVEASNWRGMPVIEATNGRGMAVTKGTSGLPITFVNASGAIIPPPPALVTTWDAATGTNVTLSNGNLKAAATTTTNGQVRGTNPKSSGKYYFETLITSGADPGWGGPGISTASPVGSGDLMNPQNAIFCSPNQAIIYGGTSALVYCASSGFVSADIICGAFNLDTRRAWFRKNGLIWNNNATADPATNTGGVDFSAWVPGLAYPIVTLQGSGYGQFTANFGASAFSFPVPYGYIGGWG